MSQPQPAKRHWTPKAWFRKRPKSVPVVPAFLEIDESHSHIQNLNINDAQMGPRVTDNYRVLACVGKGTYGTVWKAKHKPTGETRAIKKLVGGLGVPHTSRQIARECLLLKQLEHPNVIRLHEFLPGEAENDIYLIFDFVNTTLLIILQLTGLRPGQARNLAYQALRGLKYLHSAEVLHRDLKPENLLIAHDGTLKIVDFGLARTLPTHSRYMTNDVATLWYRPIELLLGGYIYDAGVDMWSMGCIIYEMYTRQPLFDASEPETMLGQIVEELGWPSNADLEALRAVCPETDMNLSRISQPKRGPKKLDEKEKLEPGVKEFILPMLSMIPGERCTAERALRNVFMEPFHHESREPACPFVAKLPYNDDMIHPMIFYKRTLFPEVFGSSHETADMRPDGEVDNADLPPPATGDEDTWQLLSQNSFNLGFRQNQPGPPPPDGFFEVDDSLHLPPPPAEPPSLPPPPPAPQLLPKPKPKRKPPPPPQTTPPKGPPVPLPVQAQPEVQVPGPRPQKPDLRIPAPFSSTFPTYQAISSPRTPGGQQNKSPRLPLPAMEQARLRRLSEESVTEPQGLWPEFPRSRHPLQGRTRAKSMPPTRGGESNGEFTPNHMADWPSPRGQKQPVQGRKQEKYAELSSPTEVTSPMLSPSPYGTFGAEAIPFIPAWENQSKPFNATPPRWSNASPRYQWDIAPQYVTPNVPQPEPLAYAPNLDLVSSRFSPALPFSSWVASHAYSAPVYISPGFG